MGHPGRNQNTDWLHSATVQNCGKFSQAKVVFSLWQDMRRKEIQHFLIWLSKITTNAFPDREYFASKPRTGRQSPGMRFWAGLPSARTRPGTVQNWAWRSAEPPQAWERWTQIGILKICFELMWV